MSERTFTDEIVAALWSAYRAGEPVHCPYDQHNVALSVDGRRSYRLSCTHCGVASGWFTSAPDGILIRVSGGPSSPPHGAPDP